MSDNSNILNKIKESNKLVTLITGDFIFGIMGSKEACASFLNLILGTEVKIKKLKRKLVDDELIEIEVKTNDDIYNTISAKAKIEKLKRKLVDDKLIEADYCVYCTSSREAVEDSIGMRLVRLDILAEIENKLYNIKMQCNLNDNFTKLTRFYQEVINIELLPMERKVPSTYIIYIMKTDYFKLGYPTYTFTPRCYENPNLEMNDRIVKFFINLSSKRNKFEKLGLLIKRVEEIKTKVGENRYVGEQRKFNRTEEFYNKMYDLIDIFNRKTKFNKKLNKDIKNILDAIEKARKDKRVIEMITTMSKCVEELELYGEQQGLQRGKIRNTIILVCNGLKENIMLDALSSLISVSYNFVCYVENYIKNNPDKTDEEKINNLVDKVMNGEISTE